MATKKETAAPASEADSKALANIPKHLQQHVGSTTGQEEVSADDLAVPRISLVQALTPARDKSSDAYIEGLEEGDVYNTLTEDIYGKEITCIPCYYRREYQIWKKKRSGSGGFYGSYDEGAEAAKQLKVEEADRDLQGQLEVMEVPVFFVLVVTPDGLIEAVVSMPRTKAKIAKRWNSLIRLTQMPSFASLYTLSSVNDENDQGKFFNFAVKGDGYASETQFAAGEKLYEAVKSGNKKAAPEEAYDGTEADGRTADTEGGANPTY